MSLRNKVECLEAKIGMLGMLDERLDFWSGKIYRDLAETTRDLIAIKAAVAISTATIQEILKRLDAIERKVNRIDFRIKHDETRL